LVLVSLLYTGLQRQPLPWEGSHLQCRQGGGATRAVAVAVAVAVVVWSVFASFSVSVLVWKMRQKA
jgi:hypothetical protein